MKVFRVRSLPFLFSIFCLALAFFSGCSTTPKAPEKIPPTTATSPVAEPKPVPAPEPIAPVKPAVPPPVAPVATSTSAATSTTTKVAQLPALPIVKPAVVGRATIRGSQESSILLDNFTAFVVAVDGKKVEAGRTGWDTPLQLEAGQRVLTVEFNRGVFMARAQLELDAANKAHYELKYTTDAELFGHNTYCNFWIVDLGNNEIVTTLQKASVEKISQGASSAKLP